MAGETKSSSNAQRGKETSNKGSQPSKPADQASPYGKGGKKK